MKDFNAQAFNPKPETPRDLFGLTVGQLGQAAGGTAEIEFVEVAG